MNENTNSLNWFEIPALDINRATQFYETIFNLSMGRMEMGDTKMAMFPSAPGSGKASGGLAESPMHQPSAEGAIIYLNANPNMDAVLAKVNDAGGKIAMPKTQISPEIGFMAFIIDTEGNKVGLHSQE